MTLAQPHLNFIACSRSVYSCSLQDSSRSFFPRGQRSISSSLSWCFKWVFLGFLQGFFWGFVVASVRRFERGFAGSIMGFFMGGLCWCCRRLRAGNATVPRTAITIIRIIRIRAIRRRCVSIIHRTLQFSKSSRIVVSLNFLACLSTPNIISKFRL